MIEFQFLDIKPIQLNYINGWFADVCALENKTLGAIAIVVGTDDWLLEQNQTYLDHDFYTDIITFDYCENNIVSGDLLISIDRINENAQTYNVSRETELNRVLVHGLLHLCGYNDKTKDEIEIMRKKEEDYLALL